MSEHRPLVPDDWHRRETRRLSPGRRCSAAVEELHASFRCLLECDGLALRHVQFMLNWVAGKPYVLTSYNFQNPVTIVLNLQTAQQPRRSCSEYPS
jgi:hypothetical protein